MTGQPDTIMPEASAEAAPEAAPEAHAEAFAEASAKAEKSDSHAVRRDNQPSMPHSISEEDKTLVSADALAAAYRALGHAALSLVQGNNSCDPLL